MKVIKYIGNGEKIPVVLPAYSRNMGNSRQSMEPAPGQSFAIPMEGLRENN